MTPSGAFPLHKHAAPKARSGNTERKQSISFEFFPPKNEKMEAALWQTVERLEPLAPSFVSVTYGAGGSTRERTLATVRRIAAETSLPVAAHLTCVAAVRGEVDAVARSFLDAGIRQIVLDQPSERAPASVLRTRTTLRAFLKFLSFEGSVDPWTCLTKVESAV